MLSRLRDHVARFVTTLRTWCTGIAGSPARDIDSEQIASQLLNCDVWSDSDEDASTKLQNQHTQSQKKKNISRSDTSSSSASSPSPPLSLLPFASAFSTQATKVVPLVAARVSLPDSLNIVPFERVLPPEVAARYSEAAAPSLLRPLDELMLLNLTHRLRKPRVNGSRAEYVKLIARGFKVGMFDFTSQPRCVNGVFTVAKDVDKDRLIIDAQPANRLFVDPPHVDLPNPSHLVQLQIPSGEAMATGKSDLSDFYHHLGIWKWIQPYLALPPLTSTELAEIGAPAGCAYPMCTTAPMGWTHSVALAQTSHLHVVYSGGALSPEDSILNLTSPLVTSDRVLHGIIVDDLWLHSLNQHLAQEVFDRVLAAYRAAGFLVKQSKVVKPTFDPVKVIGFDIDGRTGSITLPVESQLSLRRDTLSLLHYGFASSVVLEHIVGRWTWVMMLRRPSLAVLQQCYRYCRVAWGRHFKLWPSVRRELHMLLDLQPLLTAQLHQPMFHRVIASDASEIAAGVVATPLDSDLSARIWPLCSSRHIAALQTQFNSEKARTALEATCDRYSEAEAAAARSTLASFDNFYITVSSARWSTLISKVWSNPSEHINVLELRSALLALHWTLSFPSSLDRRLFLLLDSSVALFSLWKGRSSSPPLLLILRKISALLLAGGLSLLCGWVPSAINPADEPSRRRIIDT